MAPVRTVRIDGAALRELREDRGLTVAQLGSAIGRHAQSVRRLETGDGKPASRVFARQLGRALKADISEFVLAEETKAPERREAEHAA